MSGPQDELEYTIKSFSHDSCFQYYNNSSTNTRLRWPRIIVGVGLITRRKTTRVDQGGHASTSQKMNQGPSTRLTVITPAAMGAPAPFL
jgi:hypothetical protein